MKRRRNRWDRRRSHGSSVSSTGSATSRNGGGDDNDDGDDNVGGGGDCSDLELQPAAEAAWHRMGRTFNSLAILTPIARCLVYLEAMLELLSKNHSLCQWLKKNKYREKQLGVQYHCFLVPNLDQLYVNMFTRCQDNGVMEKIEYFLCYANKY